MKKISEYREIHDQLMRLQYSNPELDQDLQIVLEEARRKIFDLMMNVTQREFKVYEMERAKRIIAKNE